MIDLLDSDKELESESVTEAVQRILQGWLLWSESELGPIQLEIRVCDGRGALAQRGTCTR